MYFDVLPNVDTGEALDVNTLSVNWPEDRGGL